MISPDHPTFLRTKVHTHGNVPVAMAGTGIKAGRIQKLRRHERGEVKTSIRPRVERNALVHRENIATELTETTERKRNNFFSVTSVFSVAKKN